jgi:hypothetical protein
VALLTKKENWAPLRLQKSLNMVQESFNDSIRKEENIKALAETKEGLKFKLILSNQLTIMNDIKTIKKIVREHHFR